MWRHALGAAVVTVVAVVALSQAACVQILGDDFEISDGNAAGGANVSDGPGAGVGGAGTGGTASGGTGAGGVATPTLTVTVVGSGTGRIVSVPEGIDCPTSCAAQFPAGASVTLTVEPAADSAFLGWADDCSGQAACSVTMDADRAVGSTLAVHGERRWVNQVGNPGDDYLLDMVSDPSGNIIVAGTVRVTAGGSPDIFVAKLSATDGAPIWEKVFPTATLESGGAVTVDAQGNVYVGYWVMGSGAGDSIEGFTFQGDLFGNVLVMRLAAADGSVEWLEEWGGSGQDRPHALGVSGNDLFIAGETSSITAVFGSFTLGGGIGDAFLTRVNRANGTVLDGRTFGGNNDISDMAVNDSGGVLLVGQYRAATTIDAGVVLPTSRGMADGMVVAFDGSDLSAKWAKTFGDSNNDGALGAVAVSGAGVVVTGSFQGSVLFASSGSSLTSNGGSRDAFAVRYTAAGDHVWSFRYGGAGSDSGRAVAVTPTGEVVLAGTFSDTITFGTHVLTGTGPAWDVFVTRMSADMAPIHEWAVGLGGDGSDSCESAVVDAAGDVYLTSQFSGMTSIDGLPLTSTMYDSWVAGLVR